MVKPISILAYEINVVYSLFNLQHIHLRTNTVILQNAGNKELIEFQFTLVQGRKGDNRARVWCSVVIL